MYVLDTNTLIYFFKGVGNVAKNLLNHSPREIGIPSIVLFELEVGIAKSSAPDKRMKQLEEIISIVSILDFTAKEAKVAAAIRAQLEKAGTPIGPFDTLIGATALANQSTLVTHNIKEFSRINKLPIEDWYQ